jgi:hypothetical protein
MIRVDRRCHAHIMKYASLLLGYLLLMPYGASAREEPVENRIVNTLWKAHKGFRILAYAGLIMAVSIAYNTHFVRHLPLYR